MGNAHHQPSAPFSEEGHSAWMKKMPADIQVPHISYYPRFGIELDGGQIMKSKLVGRVKKSLIRDVLLESNFRCLYNKD
ncbi:hypothetical protein UM89_16585 [Bacillus subtilis]|nr:hypothetical protein UM89_16585 [Bacillus subtilis]